MQREPTCDNTHNEFVVPTSHDSTATSTSPRSCRPCTDGPEQDSPEVHEVPIVTLPLRRSALSPHNSQERPVNVRDDERTTRRCRARQAPDQEPRKDYGSEGWGFESLRARSLRQRPP